MGLNIFHINFVIYVFKIVEFTRYKLYIHEDGKRANWHPSIKVIPLSHCFIVCYLMRSLHLGTAHRGDRQLGHPAGAEPNHPEEGGRVLGKRRRQGALG